MNTGMQASCNEVFGLFFLKKTLSPPPKSLENKNLEILALLMCTTWLLLRTLNYPLCLCHPPIILNVVFSH